MSGFGRLVEAEIPRLRRYARALARDADAADDLVQNCITRALSKQHLWQAGTDLRAWPLHDLAQPACDEIRRSAREANTSPLDDVGLAPAVQPNAIPRLQLRDLEVALTKIPSGQREVILLVGLEGTRYEAALPAATRSVSHAKPAYDPRFSGTDGGELEFLAIEADLDVRYGSPDGAACAECSWEGFDDGTAVSGRGWVTLGTAGRLVGHFFIHKGDASGFIAERD